MKAPAFAIVPILAPSLLMTVPARRATIFNWKLTVLSGKGTMWNTLPHEVMGKRLSTRWFLPPLTSPTNVFILPLVAAIPPVKMIET